MAGIPTSIYITHLEREGLYIKVWGQTDRNLPVAIEKALQQMTPQFEQGLYTPAIENFQVGIMCCAKFKDELYYRARITNTTYLTQGMIEVLFVDYGNRDIIPCMNTRTMSGLSASLISIPAQARDFILANVTLGNWDINHFEMICNELRYLEFQLVPVLEVGPYVLISLYMNKQNIIEALVNSGLLLNVSMQMQQMTLIARNSPPGLSVNHQIPLPVTSMPPPPQPLTAKIAPVTQPVSTPTLLTYKALPLDNESEHEVYISYVSDGPCLFSVQLKKMEEQLKRLMAEINSMDLQPLEEYPLPGTVCLAQSSEDEYICRAVVTSMVDGQYKVFYVDFGNTELLSFDKLFQIPFKYMIPKVMATRFALAGLENATVSIEMKCKFKEFVNNRPLWMRVKPAATKSALPLCELWDNYNVKAIDMIKEAALLSYPEPAPLSRGISQDIKVSYVYSCNRFYVQLKSKENELQQLMNSLQQTCHSRSLFNVNDIKIGVPCCAIFVDDQLWYRAEILDVEGDSFKIRYVDFGNENTVTYNDLKVPMPEHITALRPQAIECCLSGYQNIEPDEQRDILLEELILEQELSMRVVDVQNSKALVDLYDKQHYNVASLLLEKVASASSMVSPLLIQDNHRIEHRKRSPPQANQREFRDKKPLRELNDRNRENKQENWRQSKFSRNSEDEWDEPQTEKQSAGRFKSNTRNNESEWEKSDGSENRNSSYGNKRFDDQRGKNFGSRDNNDDRTNDNNEWDTQDNFQNKNNFSRGPRRNTNNDNFDDGDRNNFENRNTFQRGKRNDRDDFKGKGNFGNRDDGFEKRDRGFDRRDGRFEKREGGFERRDRGFEKRDGGFEKRDGFEKKFNRNQDFQNNRKFDEPYQKRNFNENRSGGGDDGFFKPRNRGFNKKDGSEKSWSDTSEKSWQKGPKSSFDKPKRDFGGSHKGFSPPTTHLSNDNAVIENWGDSDTTATNDVTYDYAIETDTFHNYLDLLGSNEKISVSWFYNPVNFYCQLEKNKNEFKEMMEEIQTNYRNRKTTTANVGAPIVALFPEDGALYRAEVQSVQLNKYQVRYVDYGNVATVNKIYQIEKKYMVLPAQAIACGLIGIGPSDGNWPDPDTYSNYFDKESFNCQFVTYLDNRYYVDLSSDDSSVAALLAEASLAVPTQAAVNVDTSLLTNQQLVVVLRSAASLQDLVVELEPGVTINATMHNLATATTTYEDNLKLWVGHYVIMYVDNVLEDRVEVTLYDLTGQKLQILTPDEGSYNSVDPLCPLPIYTSQLQGWVSYASVESLYLQPAKYADTVAQLLEALFQHYDTFVQEEPVLVTLGEIYAVLSSDTNWYRGCVADIKEEDVIVTYIDYGNTEKVSVSQLRDLLPQFFQPHMLAVEISVPGDKEQYSEQDIVVNVKYGSVGWEGEIVEVLPNEIVADDEEVQKKVEEISVQQSETTIVPSTQDDLIPEEIESEIKPTQQIGVSVIISHIDTPTQFYLQLLDARESISLLQEQLQQQITDLPDLENPTAGVLCAAPYSVCQQWFRAQVLDADDDITMVRFVDFGNTDVIDNTSVQVKTLPTEMLSIEFHAKLCSLSVQPVGEEWNATAIDNFEMYTSVENVSAKIVYQDEKTTYVELYADEKNVGELLKQEGFAVDLQLETEKNSTGFISHLNSPSEFWIQLEASCGDLEWVADQLASADTYPTLEDLTPGSLCAAVFPGDDSWYRARILSNTVAGLEVIFIDYGNSCSCSDLRELPEDLIIVPALAMKCSLQKPEGILQWSQAATEKFKEISADGATVFNVNIFTAGETSVIQLTFNDQDISSQLLPETRQCFISHVDSLDSFWVQYMDDNVQIDNVTTEMENAESWPEVNDVKEGSLYAALYEDELWYRAKMIGNSDDACDVLFIDYGNKACVVNLRELPESCAAIEPLAYNFRLEPLPRTKWGEESEEIFSNLTESGVAIFDAEIVTENSLRLYLNGFDVRSSLELIKCTPSMSHQSSPKKTLREPVLKSEDIEEAFKGEDLNVESTDELEDHQKIVQDMKEQEIGEKIEDIETIEKRDTKEQEEGEKFKDNEITEEDLTKQQIGDKFEDDQINKENMKGQEMGDKIEYKQIIQDDMEQQIIEDKIKDAQKIDEDIKEQKITDESDKHKIDEAISEPVDAIEDSQKIEEGMKEQEIANKIENNQKIEEDIRQQDIAEKIENNEKFLDDKQQEIEKVEDIKNIETDTRDAKAAEKVENYQKIEEDIKASIVTGNIGDFQQIEKKIKATDKTEDSQQIEKGVEESKDTDKIEDSHEIKKVIEATKTTDQLENIPNIAKDIKDSELASNSNSKKESQNVQDIQSEAATSSEALQIVNTEIENIVNQVTYNDDRRFFEEQQVEMMRQELELIARAAFEIQNHILRDGQPLDLTDNLNIENNRTQTFDYYDPTVESEDSTDETTNEFQENIRNTSNEIKCDTTSQSEDVENEASNVDEETSSNKVELVEKEGEACSSDTKLKSESSSSSSETGHSPKKDKSTGEIPDTK